MSKIKVSTEDNTKSDKKTSKFSIKKVLQQIKQWFRKVEQWYKQLKRQWKIAILAILIAIVAIIAFLIIKTAFFPSPDVRLRRMAEDYYSEKIVTAEKRSTSYTLVLSNMQKIGYDVSPFERAGCSLDSYAVIFLTNPNETDAKKIDHQVSTKLIDCK